MVWLALMESTLMSMAGTPLGETLARTGLGKEFSRSTPYPPLTHRSAPTAFKSAVIHAHTEEKGGSMW